MTKILTLISCIMFSVGSFAGDLDGNWEATVFTNQMYEDEAFRSFSKEFLVIDDKKIIDFEVQGAESRALREFSLVYQGANKVAITHLAQGSTNEYTYSMGANNESFELCNNKGCREFLKSKFSPEYGDIQTPKIVEADVMEVCFDSNCENYAGNNFSDMLSDSFDLNGRGVLYKGASQLPNKEKGVSFFLINRFIGGDSSYIENYAFYLFVRYNPDHSSPNDVEVFRGKTAETFKVGKLYNWSFKYDGHDFSFKMKLK